MPGCEREWYRFSQIPTVNNAPILRVHYGVLQRHDERVDFGVARPKRSDKLAVSHHPLIGHQEIEEAVLLRTAGFDFKLCSQQGVKIPVVASAIGED